MDQPGGSPHGLDLTRQRRIGVRDALGEVETALATAAGGRAETWVATMSERLAALEDAWHRHVEQAESPEGLFAQLMDDAPRLRNRVDRLRKDHATINAAIANARQKVAAAAPGGKPVDQAREAVVGLLAALVRHRYQGAEVVYEAYNVDIEAGD
ncbi:MAG TPA: hemerythrin domain-containing protein [Acidimicrobiales bacterium]|nr:hemerythrin domain-containing protein [Acidimicrobiales bacterium]